MVFNAQSHFLPERAFVMPKNVSAPTQEADAKLKLSALIGLIALVAMTMSQGATSPALATFAKVWPASAGNIALINTLPSLLFIPASLLSGRLADKGYLSYRSLALIGVLIPVLGNSFTLVLICRAIYGFGMGLFSPICNAMILLLIPGDRARHYMSITTAASNLVGILLQILGGMLSNIHWKLSFALYLLGVPCFLIMLFCLPNVPRGRVLEKAEIKKEPMGKKVYFWAMLQFGFSASFFILTNCIAMIITGNQYGTSADVGYVMATFTVGGFFGAMSSNKIFRKLHSFTLPLSALVAASGFLLIIFGQNLPLMYAGSLVFGLGFGCWNPTLQATGGRSVPPNDTATAISLITCFGNFGSFLSIYITKFFGRFFQPWDRLDMCIGCAIFLLLFFITLSCTFSRRKEN